MANNNKNGKEKKINPIAATFGELKQVSWPTFSQTMKALGAVLVVTVAFLIVLTAIDALLGFIHSNLFQIAAYERDNFTPEQIAAIIVGAVLVVGSIVGVVLYKVFKKKD